MVYERHWQLYFVEILVSLAILFAKSFECNDHDHLTICHISNKFSYMLHRVQFEDVHRLSDGQVKHSPEVYYAGSFWKVFILYSKFFISMTWLCISNCCLLMQIRYICFNL